MKVLLIDDEDDIRKIAGLGLSRIGGMEVLDASSGAAGLALAKSGKPDVILLDVNMPPLSGIDILRRLRANGATASVVMLTGDDSASTATEALRAGAFHYVVKPMLNNALVEKVHQCFRQLTEIVWWNVGCHSYRNAA